MDSFYDQPRNAPKPTNVNKLTGPLIPEVSIIQPSDKNVTHGVSYRTHSNASYNVWKARNVSEPPQHDKENFRPQCAMNRQFSDPNGRKHVRFESPTLHRSNSGPCEGAGFNVGLKNLDTRALEEIYMANIPNRNLDLSVLDLSANKKSDETIDNNNCYDIYNYKGVSENVPEIKEDAKQIKTYADFRKQLNDDTKRRSQSPFKSSNDEEHLFSRDLCNKLIKNDHRHFRCDNSMYGDNFLSTRRQNEDEPTTRDLLKVIQQQNEQILLLQKQMACLLDMKANQKQIEDAATDLPTSNLPIDHERHRKKKGPLSKIAIDVMTSFEVSFRPQNQNFPQKNKLREIDDSPKIEEINDATNDVANVLDGIKKSDKFDANGDVSLSLQEPLKVMERCPSPEQSIHVEMQDYSSDEEDTDSTLGWTLYNNIMGQVNNIFKHTQSDTHRVDSDQHGSDVIKDKTLKRVKEATMKHLKTIGVNLPLIEENDVSKEQSKSSESDVSFAVKQLLMKYLPDEQLAKLTNKEVKQPQLNENLIKRRPEFSFATVQYMKKYNLLASEGTKGQPVKPQSNSPKILDVTALKQQPKLL